jgi:hypothetical protein
MNKKCTCDYSDMDLFISSNYCLTTFTDLPSSHFIPHNMISIDELCIAYIISIPRLVLVSSCNTYCIYSLLMENMLYLFDLS